MVFGAVGWILGTTMLFLGGGIDVEQALRAKTWHRAIPSLVGALSLIGAPFTVGFVAESGVLEGVVSTGRWGWGVAFFLGQGLLVAAVVRWLLAGDSAGRPARGLVGRAAYGVAMVVLALSLVIVGIVPDRVTAGLRLSYSFSVSLKALLSAPRLVGWLLWGGAVVLGAVLAWGDRILRPRVSLWLDGLHDVLLLDWGYELLMGAFEQGFGLLRVVDDVLAGRGALLWSCILLLILVLMGGR
jgi:NADH:ubiquinone oxidoreductase subunit 5 (subunit L)/multisubunit Na+/H+ antiporter MnhA subunit